MKPCAFYWTTVFKVGASLAECCGRGKCDWPTKEFIRSSGRRRGTTSPAEVSRNSASLGSSSACHAACSFQHKQAIAGVEKPIKKIKDLGGHKLPSCQRGGATSLNFFLKILQALPLLCPTFTALPWLAFALLCFAFVCPDFCDFPCLALLHFYHAFTLRLLHLVPFKFIYFS